MPSVETFGRTEKAVLWRLGDPNRHGEPTVYDPVELDVRWEETRVDVLSPLTGQMVTKLANVVVDTEIEIGSLMWRGELVDVGATGDFRQVIEYRETKDVKGRNVRRVVGLCRYQNSLPASMPGTGTGP